MADKKAMTALFKMCTELKKEVETLREEVKELRDARTAPEKILESMNHLSEDIINAGDYAEKEIIRLDTDLSEIRKNVEASEKCRRTTIQKIRALETSVYRGQASSRRQRPERDQQRRGQFRKPWVRVCYNCRKPGHIAMCCPKPNPRNEILSASPKPTLSGILKRKLPEANSVQPNAETEPRKQVQSLSVGVANIKERYEPRISLNPRLAGYDMNKLGICVVPYGSEADNPRW